MIFNELKRRHAENIKCHIDYENNVATFYLHGILSKRLLGYQVYNPNTTNKKSNDARLSRYFTHQSSFKETGEYAVFGLEYINNRDKLFVTEGIFEASRLISLGFDAIAILTSNPPKNLITQLFTINKNIIWCGDNDKAGKTSRLAQFMHLYFDRDLDEVDEKTLLSAIERL